MNAKITEISFDFSENKDLNCKTVQSMKEANKMLFLASFHAPRIVGHNATDFTVKFSDGTSWKGQYELVHVSRELPNLARYVRNHILIRSGSMKPEGMTCEQYSEFMDGINDDKQEMMRFLATHDLY